MGGFHCHNLAYLAAGDHAIAALGRMSPSIAHATCMPPNIRCSDGRAVLCVKVARPYVWPETLRTEFEGVDITAFDEYQRVNPASAYDEEDESSELESDRALVRALMWLSVQADDPVGYWHHAGDHGMIADMFIGAWPFAMWENDSEFQGDNWDESKPRSAYTGALWHIGARVPNVDECRSMGRALIQPRIPVAAFSAEFSSSADQGKYDSDASAVTERLNRLYRTAPARDDARPSTMAAKWITRLKRIMSRD